MTKLYFVRHGLTANNAIHAFNGSYSNHGLLPEGQQQASELGQFLREVHFEKTYVSPQKRAIETAQYILKENQFSVNRLIEEEKLKEINFGDWDGVSIDSKEGHPQLRNLRHHPEQYNPSEFQGESYPSLIQRGTSFIQQLDYTTNANYLIVSHGVTLTTLLQTLKGKAIAQIREDGLLDNTSLSILETKNGKSFQEKCWNYIAY